MDENEYHQLIEQITFDQLRRLSIRAAYSTTKYK